MIFRYSSMFAGGSLGRSLRTCHAPFCLRPWHYSGRPVGPRQGAHFDEVGLSSAIGGGISVKIGAVGVTVTTVTAGGGAPFDATESSGVVVLGAYV